MVLVIPNNTPEQLIVCLLRFIFVNLSKVQPLLSEKSRILQILLADEWPFQMISRLHDLSDNKYQIKSLNFKILKNLHMTGKKLNCNKCKSRYKESCAVEDLPEVCNTAELLRSQPVKSFPSKRKQQHPQLRKH